MSLTTFTGNRISMKRDGRRASSGVIIAVTGIAVAFVIMLLAVSIVRGFKDEIVRKLEGFNAQISILPPTPVNEEDNTVPMRLTDTLAADIHAVVPEAEISLSFSQPAVLKTDSTFQGIVLQGIGSERTEQFITRNLAEGAVNTADTMSVVISRETASALNLSRGQKVMTHIFDGNNLRSRNLTVTGIYDSHFSDFDRALAFTPMSMLQSIYRTMPNEGTSLEIYGLSSGNLDESASNLRQQLLLKAINRSAKTGSECPIFRVESLNDRCAMYINWLNLLDTNVIVILTLMAFVSGFTLISSLFIIILEKVNMIGLFKALGASNTAIRKIFIYLAQRLVVRGLIIGNVIGIGIILLQRSTHILPLDPDAYYLNYVPMALSPVAIVTLNICVILTSAIILILPTSMISSLSPVKSLKYE